MALKDIGYDVDIRFSTPSETPELDGKGGTAYVGDDGKHTVIINSGYLSGKTKVEILGVISEEASHVINGAEGRQIAKGTAEKGLESTGRATNEYFQDKYRGDDTAISIQSDGKDYSNVDFGEHVGDGCIPKGYSQCEYVPDGTKGAQNSSKKPPKIESSGKEGLSLILDFVPVVGDVKSALEIVTGRDIVTGVEMTLLERVLAVIPYAKEITKGFEKGFKIFKKANGEKIVQLSDGTKIALKSDEVAKFEKTAKKTKVAAKETSETIAKNLTRDKIKNMSLDEITQLGKLKNKRETVARYIKGTNSDAIKFFESRIVREETIRNTSKGIVRVGYDKFGNKIVYRGFSSKGKSVPTIDFYKNKDIIRELKFD